jgi:glucosamine--fructose-6-phosphate aminotransferase (isomerizing)
MPTSILDHEIREQPRVIRKLLNEERESIARLVDEVRGSFDYVVIAARGTSDNAARYAQYLFGAHNSLQVALATPSLFTLYDRPPNLERALIVGISQSGVSPDIVSVLAEGKRQGRPAIAITNEPDSPLAQVAEHVIRLHTGDELAVAATKTYTSSLAALALFSALLNGDRRYLDELSQLTDFMEQTLDGLGPMLARVERYRYMERCVMIGRGFNYATTFEIALKVKELTRTVAEPYSSADFRHGPIALVRDGFPVMVVAPSSAASADIRDFIADVLNRGAELLLISDDPELLRKAHFPLPLPPGVPEWLSPMVAILPGQLFGLHLALARGFNPDHPQGITKVTETR